LKTGIKWPQSLANQPGNANRKSRNFAKQVSAYGLRSLAAAEPNATLNVEHLSSPGQTKLPIAQHGAEGPDAFQIVIKVSNSPLLFALFKRGVTLLNCAGPDHRDRINRDIDRQLMHTCR